MTKCEEIYIKKEYNQRVEHTIARKIKITDAK